MSFEHRSKVISPNGCAKTKFMNMAVSKLYWGDLSDVEMVMDIGSGSGNSSLLIAKLFPNVKKIVGIDNVDYKAIHPERIKSHEKITYYVADITKRSSLSEWIGKMTRIFSINCFNYIENKEEAFRNVYNLLKTGGGAALIFALYSPMYECLDQVLEIPKWRENKRILKCFNDSLEHKITSTQIRSILEKVGFEIIFCEMTNGSLLYSSEEICKEYILKFVIQLDIPSGKIEEFKKDYFKTFEKINGRSMGGRLCLKYQYINILLKKY